MAETTILDELIELSAQAEEEHETYLDLAEKAKDSKKKWEGLTLRIQAKLKACRETHPLFDGKADDDPADDDDSGGGGGGPDDDPGPISPVSPGDGDVIDVSFEPSRPALPAPAFYQPVPAALKSESWRSDPMELLVDHGLTDKTLGLLDEAAIRTIGALADWSNSGKRLIDIDGIGEARAAEIEEAMEGYWADWSKRQQAPKSGGDLVTSRPGSWANDEVNLGSGEDRPRKSRKKKTA